MTIVPVNLTDTATHSKLRGLDHLRAFAISFVFIFHYGRIFASPAWITAIGKFGWTGVDLFFVLSGYLISAQLFAGIAKGKKIAAREFFLKRFFRIIPPYMLVVAIYFCFPAAREREAPAPLWKYLSFTQNLGIDLSRQGTFSHAWSLCIEEQFYLLLPLTLMAMIYVKAIKKGWLLLAALFVLGLAARWYVYDHIVVPAFEAAGGWITWYKWIYYPTYSRLDGLLTGVGIAALFQFRPLLKQRLVVHGNKLLLLSIFVLAAAYYLCIDEESFGASVFGFPLISIGYGLMVMGAISPNSFLYQYKSGITAKLATLSYGIYLTHKIIIHLAQVYLSKINIARDSNWMLLLAVVACIAGALLMNTLIEKPSLKLRGKIVAWLNYRSLQRLR